MNPRSLVLTAVAIAVTALAACSTLPEPNAALDQARTQLRTAQQDPAVSRLAGSELQQATTSVQRAEQAQTDRLPRAEIDHLAYLGHQRVTIAQETAAGRTAQAVTATAAAERDRMLLASRTREADVTQRQLAASEQQGQRKSAELAQADRNAAEGQSRLARSDARADDLELQLQAMNARKTERGIVVTLGDMLFDSGQSRLQASGARSIGKLADFMKRYPNRRAAIDGYTDNVGGEASNQLLSDRRADAVMTALVSMGVGQERLTTQGHGERDPVASNDTQTGRQTNRRVEIVISTAGGEISSR